MVANDRLRSIDRDGPYGRLEGDSQYMLTGAAMGTHSRAGVEKLRDTVRRPPYGEPDQPNTMGI